MAAIERTFHSWQAIQQWIDEAKKTTVQPNVTIISEESEPLDDYHASLSPEQLAEIEAGIERGLADVKAGRVLTCDQVRKKLHTEFDKRYANNTK